MGNLHQKTSETSNILSNDSAEQECVQGNSSLAISDSFEAYQPSESMHYIQVIPGGNTIASSNQRKTTLAMSADMATNTINFETTPPYQTKFVKSILDNSHHSMIPESRIKKKRTRNRPIVSCLTCKHRKIKCDRSRPICGSCKKSGNVECHYQIIEKDLQLDTSSTNNSNISNNIMNQNNLSHNNIKIIDNSTINSNADNEKSYNESSTLLTSAFLSPDSIGECHTNNSYAASISSSYSSLSNNENTRLRFAEANTSSNDMLTNCNLAQSGDQFNSPRNNTIPLLVEPMNNQYEKVTPNNNIKLNNPFDNNDTKRPNNIDNISNKNMITNYNDNISINDNQQEINFTKYELEGKLKNVDSQTRLSFNATDISSTPLIMKNLNLIQNSNIKTGIMKDLSVGADKIKAFFGGSLISSFVQMDYRLRLIFEKLMPSIAEDIDKWDNTFSFERYSNALERKISVESVQQIGSSIDDKMDFKFVRFNCICNHLEAYFIDYITFLNLVSSSTIALTDIAPILPDKAIDFILSKHFISDPCGKLKIVDRTTMHDIVEITFILTVARFGLNDNKGLFKAPEHVNFNSFLDEETILQDNKTDLLHSIIKMIVTDFKLQNYNSLLNVGIFVLLFFVKISDRTSSFSAPPNGINFGIMSIYMGITIGVFSTENYNLVQPMDNTQNYLTFLTADDLENIKALLIIIDTVHSFQSGIPQMIIYPIENLKQTNFLTFDTIGLLYYYRNTYNLVNKDVLSESEPKCANAFNLVNNEKGEACYSLNEYESFVENFEALLSNYIFVFGSDLILRPGHTRFATPHRFSNLLCYMYMSGYKIVKESVKKVQADPNHNPKELKQLKVLEVKEFHRCFKMAILRLAALNESLNTPTDSSEFYYLNYSIDLIQMFSRNAITLISLILRLIVEEKANSEFYHTLLSICSVKNEERKGPDPINIFSLSHDALQCIVLYNVDRLNENHYTILSREELELLDTKLNRLIVSPFHTLNFILTFFFQCSKTRVSQSFEFIMFYKYCISLLKSFYESSAADIPQFDIDQWVKSVSDISITWFTNNQ